MDDRKKKPWKNVKKNNKAYSSNTFHITSFGMKK